MMIKKEILPICTFLMLLLFSSSIFGYKEPSAISIHERYFENQTLNAAYSLIQQRKSEDAIAMLKEYREKNQKDFDSDILLAEAYLEKCSQMRETMDESEREYKRTVFIPFNIGKQIIIRYKYDNRKLSFGYYIYAKSLGLNNRPARAEKYLEYAMEQIVSPDIHYFILKADVMTENFYQILKNILSDHYSLKKNSDMTSDHQNVINAYEHIVNATENKLIKGRLYYKMGVFELNYVNLSKDDTTLIEYVNNTYVKKAQEYFSTALITADERTKAMSYYYLGVIQNKQGDKETAQKSFASALNLAKDELLKNMIQNNMN